MTLAPGARLGPCEIAARLGEGGVGEVWRAHDAKLERDVAIKVLATESTRDESTVPRDRTPPGSMVPADGRAARLAR